MIPSLLLALVSVGSVSGVAQAAEPFPCADSRLGTTPVQVDGRAIPLFAHAARTKRFLVGKSCPEIPATQWYCLASTGQLDSLKGACEPRLKFEHEETRNLLGVSGKDAAPELVTQRKDDLLTRLHTLGRAGEKSSGRTNDLENLLTRLDRWNTLTAGNDWRTLSPTGEWKARAGGLEEALGQEARLGVNERSTFRLEIFYERTQPMRIAAMLALVGFLISLLALKRPGAKPAAVAAIALLFAVHVATIVIRVLISGRAPITNMYETVMVAGFGMFILASVIGFVRKDSRVWAAGFAGASVALLMLNFATSMLDGTIQPLVPVLRDNFWLSTHVTSVILAYACFGLSWVMANYTVVRWLAGARKGPFVEGWNSTIRLSIQIGTVFLAGGVLLGGVWADYSWGRFWGWDPKETWSLIALIVYVAILHGRYVGWFSGIRFTLLAALAFLFVLMAWFGVNYILAVGLHSYGFSTGGALFLGTIFAAQLALLAIATGVLLRGKAART